MKKMMWVKSLLGVVFCTGVIAFSFQNCGRVQFSSDVAGGGNVGLGNNCANDPSQCPTEGPHCVFNGTSYAEGDKVTAYLSSSVASGQTCASEERICREGSFTGSYNYASCQVNVKSSCLFNGQTIAHGASVKGYQNSSVAFGQQCVSENRTCDNGVLSGSYSYNSCSTGTATSCLFNGTTVAHGGSVVAFVRSSVSYNETCQRVTRVCNNGSLSGSGDYASCSVGTLASCLFNGTTVAHGATVNAYSTSTVAYGQTCATEKRTCNNGSLSGTYKYSSCQPGAAASCSFNGQTIANGQSTLAYATSTVAYGDQCRSIVRICNNGVLSGSGSYASCSVGAPANCLLGSVSVADGGVIKGYRNSTVPAGSSCEGEDRLCRNGVLSGSFPHVSCSVSKPQVCGNGANNYPTCSTCSSGQAMVDGSCQSCSPGNAEAWYLSSNYDVKVAVQNGGLKSGLEHWCNYGRSENRAACFNSSSCQPRVCSAGVSYSCDIGNGTGRKICNPDGMGYGACELVSCNSGFVQKGNSCERVGCQGFTSNSKCKMINYCQNGNAVNAEITYPAMRISITGNVGDTVNATMNNVSLIDSSDRVTRWDAMAFRCQANATWAQASEGNCEIHRTLPADDFRCRNSGGGDQGTAGEAGGDR